jgi:hypothetical protein
MRHLSNDSYPIRDFQDSAYSRNPYGNDDVLRTALWKTLVGGRLATAAPAESWYETLLDQFIVDPRTAPPDIWPDIGDLNDSWKWNFHLWVKKNSDFKICNRSLNEFFADFNEMAYEQHYYEAIGRVYSFMWARCLATMEKGCIAARVAKGLEGRRGSGHTGVLLPDIAETRWYGQVYHCCWVYLQGIMDREAIKKIKRRAWTSLTRIFTRNHNFLQSLTHQMQPKDLDDSRMHISCPVLRSPAQRQGSLLLGPYRHPDHQ